MLIKLLDSFSNIKSFNCGDADLNDFLQNDAEMFFYKRIANTYIVESEGKIIAYFSLLNDKVSRNDASNSSWKRLKKLFPRSKQFSSYPSVKVGRFVVDVNYEWQGLGRYLMTEIKSALMRKRVPAFRFLTVDAYLSAVSFYEKNGFKMLVGADKDKHTRAMYFDLLDVE